MPIITVEIIKKTDKREREMWYKGVLITKNNKQKKTKKRQKRTRGDRGYIEMVRIRWFCCAFKLGFLQLICKASLVF